VTLPNRNLFDPDRLRRWRAGARELGLHVLVVATGKTIYQEGLPDSNVPACSACHGPEAKGQDEIPRLAGQLFSYTVKELTNWRKERGQGSGSDTSAIMVPTAHNLSQSQIAAVAAYLSYLP
jgi:cytochrome c553